MEKRFAAWASAASHYISECFDLAKPYVDKGYQGLDPQVKFVAAQLFIDCHLSSESVLLLIRSGKEWDADVVCRSVMEGSIKFTYMLSGEDHEVAEKADEFWNLLPEFTRIKHSENAKRLLLMLPSPEDPEWTPIRKLVVPDEDYVELRSKYSRSDRKRVEERWSFSGILQYFARVDIPGLQSLVGLAHGYTMSSHLAHKDADGVGMVWERFMRTSEQMSAVKAGHAARVVSDVCTFASLRLLVLLKACRQQRSVIFSISTSHCLGSLRPRIPRSLILSTGD
jgi:hypothetical protein